jgi:hypothetical protein
MWAPFAGRPGGVRADRAAERRLSQIHAALVLFASLALFYALGGTLFGRD